MIVEQLTYSDKGPRHENEDSMAVLEHETTIFACIADGVGGARCGKIASTKSVDRFMENVRLHPKDLREAIRSAHFKIHHLQKENVECKGMATTFTACAVSEYQLSGVHVGDSRLCILRGNGIKQLTENQTEVQRLYRAGKIKLEDIAKYPRRHILENALGLAGELKVQEFNFGLERYDRILLTTDGVHDVITKTEFRDLSRKANTIKKFGEDLIQMLSNKPLTDNVTFIVLEIR